MAQGATVDPASLNVIFGTHRVGGFAPGSFVSVVYDVDAFNSLIGVDGEGAWFKNQNLAANVTLSLLQTSDSNDRLSAFHLADRATPNGVLLPLIVREANGRTLFTTDKARILKIPDTEWSDGIAVRAWIIRTTRLVPFVGGIAAA